MAHPRVWPSRSGHLFAAACFFSFRFRAISLHASLRSCRPRRWTSSLSAAATRKLTSIFYQRAAKDGRIGSIEGRTKRRKAVTVGSEIDGEWKIGCASRVGRQTDRTFMRKMVSSRMQLSVK